MTASTLNLAALRAQFPALQQTGPHHRPFVYFDGPGGTQVPQSVINAMGDYLSRSNANSHGLFETSRRTDAVVTAARDAMADLVNAPSPDEIVFGPNMTTLTFNIGRVIGRTIQPGDEIIVTRLDHDANVAPWVALEERGAVIRRADFDVEDCTLDMAGLRQLINPKTRLIAVGYASNAVGTINDVRTIGEWAHATGAWLYVDAVHYAPHGPIDVQTIGCDFLACSVYKFFGPHVGVLWGRHDLLERLAAYKVRPADPQPPDKFEPGTKNHEGLAGTVAAVDYLADLGRVHGGPFREAWAGLAARRRDLKAGLAAIQAYEGPLLARLLAGLQSIRGLRLYGITDPRQFDRRVPTVAFRLESHSPQEIARRLDEQGIFVWDGNYYALSVTERLGVEDSGGMVRVGIAHYNTAEEVDRLLEALAGMSAG